MIESYTNTELWSPKYRPWNMYHVSNPRLPSSLDQSLRWVDNNINKPLTLKSMILPHNEQLVQSLITFIQNLTTNELQQTSENNNDNNTCLPSSTIIHGPSGTGRTVIIEKYIQDVGKALHILSATMPRFFLHINISSSSISTAELRDIWKQIHGFSEFYKNNNIPVGYRIVIIDNIDFLTPSQQMNIKQFMELFADKIKWIFICTQPLKLIQYIQLKSLSLRLHAIAECDCLSILLKLCHRNHIGYDLMGICRLFKTLSKQSNHTATSTTTNKSSSITTATNSTVGITNSPQTSTIPSSTYSLTRLMDVMQKVFYHYHFLSEENVIRLLSPLSFSTVSYSAPFDFSTSVNSSNIVLSQDGNNMDGRDSATSPTTVSSMRRASLRSEYNGDDSTNAVSINKSNENIAMNTENTSSNIISDSADSNTIANATIKTTLSKNKHKSSSLPSPLLVVSYQSINASATVDPLTRCPICTLIPPCRHVSIEDLASIGMATRSTLLALTPTTDPSFTASSSSYTPVHNSLSTSSSSSSSSSYKLQAKLNGRGFKVLASTTTTTLTTTATTTNNNNNNMAVNLKGRRSSTVTTTNKINAPTVNNNNHNYNNINNHNNKSSQHAIQSVPIINCPEFLHFGRCSLFNQYRSCPYIHPSSFHKNILFPPKRCRQCTLILPCLHCLYSMKKKKLSELCEEIRHKGEILEKMLNVAITVLNSSNTTTAATISATENAGVASDKTTIAYKLIISSRGDDDYNNNNNNNNNSTLSPLLRTNSVKTIAGITTISSATIGNSNVFAANSISGTGTATAAAVVGGGKTRRQLAAEAEEKQLAVKQQLVDELTSLHSRNLSASNMSYLQEVEVWNTPSDTTCEVADYNAKIDYLTSLFQSLLKSRLVMHEYQQQKLKKSQNSNNNNVSASTTNDDEEEGDEGGDDTIEGNEERDSSIFLGSDGSIATSTNIED